MDRVSSCGWRLCFVISAAAQLLSHHARFCNFNLSWCACSAAAGDALQIEKERAQSLEETTAVLQKRIVNMASVRETSNKQLTGQLSQLKEKLAASRRQQQESAAQVRDTLAGRFMEYMFVALNVMRHRCSCIYAHAGGHLCRRWLAGICA
jgi:hypothetical protein